jgi:hypothetical protein
MTGSRRRCLAVLTASVLDLDGTPVWSLSLSALSEAPRFAPRFASGVRVLGVWRIGTLSSGAFSGHQWVSLSQRPTFDEAYQRSLTKLAQMGAERVQAEPH